MQSGGHSPIPEQHHITHWRSIWFWRRRIIETARVGPQIKQLATLVYTKSCTPNSPSTRGPKTTIIRAAHGKTSSKEVAKFRVERKSQGARKHTHTQRLQVAWQEAVTKESSDKQVYQTQEHTDSGKYAGLGVESFGFLMLQTQ